MAPILTNDRSLDVFSTKPIQKLNNAEAFMDRKPESSKMAFFVNFDLFVAISLILPLNFTDIFAATDNSTYFKIIPIDIFMKKFFSDDI